MVEEVEKYATTMLETFKNNGHKEETRNYLFIRKSIDKVSNYSMRNDVQALMTLDKYLKDKPFDMVSQDDLIAWEDYLKKEYGLKGSTIEQYESHVKRFYKYLSNKNEYKKGKRFQKNIPYPVTVNWISQDSKNHDSLPLEKIMTEKDLLKMLNTCGSIRDQAIIVILFDAGLRNSELLSLNIESLDLNDKMGAKLILPKQSKSEVDLKTGSRVIRLFLVPSATKYLKEYLNQHPFKNYSKSPLFISRDPRFYTKVLNAVNGGGLTEKQTRVELEKLRLTKCSIKDIVKNAGIRANVPVRKPHDLRHNSATLCCKKGFTEMEMRLRFGWSRTSKMPSTYVHLSQTDVDDHIKRITGFKEPEKKEESILQPVQCPNCEYENVPTNVVCGRCGHKLHVEKEDLVSAVDLGINLQKTMDTKALESLLGNSIMKQIQDLIDQRVRESLKQKV